MGKKKKPEPPTIGFLLHSLRNALGVVELCDGDNPQATLAGAFSDPATWIARDTIKVREEHFLLVAQLYADCLKLTKPDFSFGGLMLQIGSGPREWSLVNYYSDHSEYFTDKQLLKRMRAYSAYQTKVEFKAQAKAQRKS